MSHLVVSKQVMHVQFIRTVVMLDGHADGAAVETVRLSGAAVDRPMQGTPGVGRPGAVLWVYETTTLGRRDRVRCVRRTHVPVSITTEHSLQSVMSSDRLVRELESTHRPSQKLLASFISVQLTATGHL